MSKAKENQQQDLAMLLSAKNGLAYLSQNDWALIADKAARIDFSPGAVMVQKGKRMTGLFLLLKGTATVQIPSQVGAALIGPGEICGEISFLDELPATVNVVARDAVETYYLDRGTLLSLFELFPHLGSRFYRSLASSLSRRLRDLVDPSAQVK
jgi:CRP/FNR family cyclic AMP-dependent transcriptional regulator